MIGKCFYNFTFTGENFALSFQGVKKIAGNSAKKKIFPTQPLTLC